MSGSHRRGSARRFSGLIRVSGDAVRDTKEYKECVKGGRGRGRCKGKNMRALHHRRILNKWLSCFFTSNNSVDTQRRFPKPLLPPGPSRTSARRQKQRQERSDSSRPFLPTLSACSASESSPRRPGRYEEEGGRLFVHVLGINNKASELKSWNDCKVTESSCSLAPTLLKCGDLCVHHKQRRDRPSRDVSL